MEDLYETSKRAISNQYSQYGISYRHNLMLMIAGWSEGKVLDLGCGDGTLLEIMRLKGLEAVGVEPNIRMVKLAKKRYPMVKVKQGDIDKAKGKYDTITLTGVLEHIKYDESVLKKAYTKLNTGGQIIITVPAHPNLYGKKDRGGGHYRRYSKKQLISKLEKAGFKVLHLRYWNLIGLIPYFIFEKLLMRDPTKASNVVRSNRFVMRMVNSWFKIENKISFGMGLGIIAVGFK